MGVHYKIFHQNTLLFGSSSPIFDNFTDIFYQIVVLT
jgi:hypothetical protein